MKLQHILLSALLLISLSACNQPDIDNPNNQNRPDTVAFDVDNTHAANPNARVIYELNLYNFTSQGTLQAATARLQELSTLGIDIVWLMPIQTRSKQGKIGSLGSPYALHDYTEVNADHGTLADLQEFVKTAHDLNMEVWLDWVPNHTGLDHVWVTEHPDYYQQSNGNIVHPNNYSDVYQLNYNNAEMRQAMIDAMIYWVENADIDGFRVDYVSSPNMPAWFWQTAIQEIQNAAAGKKIWMLGEADFADKPGLYTVGFDYDYAWGFHDKLKQQLGNGSDAQAVVAQCKSLWSNTRYAQMDRMVYLTNHDDIGNNFSANYFNYWTNNVAPLTVLEFTLYGMPLLYNGQEIGYRKVQNYFNRDIINWNNPNKKLQNTIRALIALRHTQPALYGGTKAERPQIAFLPTDADSTCVAYTKTQGNNTVLVVLNFAATETQVTISDIPAGDYYLSLDSKTVDGELKKIKTKLTNSEAITLPAKGYMVFVKI